MSEAIVGEAEDSFAVVLDGVGLVFEVAAKEGYFMVELASLDVA